MTEEEKAAQGSYEYSILAYEDDSLIECGTVQVEVDIDGETLHMIEAGNENFMQDIAENTYLGNWAGMDIALLFTPTGYSWSGEDSGLSYELYAFRNPANGVPNVSYAGFSDEEVLNQGSHNYRVDFCQEDEIYDHYQGTFEITFIEGKVQVYDADGEYLYVFSKSGTDLYTEVGGDMQMVFTNRGFIWRTPDESGDDFLAFSIQ